MDREMNIDPTRAAEEQTRKHERATIKLKRAQNSLLNVFKLPPEVLGSIFRWNVTHQSDFGGLDEESHNFLLVCHHWFEVASRTPELWSFWGNTPDDWARWCRRSGNAPLDLVLSGDRYNYRYLSDNMWDVLKNRATEDNIRRVHLKSEESGLISDVIDALTPTGEELRSDSLESLVLRNLDSFRQVDVSNFFNHYRFPKLQRLDLTNCGISSWDYLPARTSALTTLKLIYTDSSPTPNPTPTTSQLLSILSSNPALRRVALLGSAIPTDGGGESSRVQLHHLKELQLGGDLRQVLKFLNQLDHPRTMDVLTLTLHGCDITDIPQTIGPYLRDHLQRRDRCQEGLSLFASSLPIYRAPEITLSAGDASGIDFSAPSPTQIHMFIKIDIVLSGAPRKVVTERTALDLTTYTPREEVVYFRMSNSHYSKLDVYTRFPNLRALSFDMTSLPAAFPAPNLVGDGKILPSLEHVLLKDALVDGNDWSPLVTFLAHRMSSGNRLGTLVIVHPYDMSPEVTEGIRGMVRELRIEN